MLAFGLGGYAAGFAASTFVQVVLRGYYMRQLFAGFHLLPQLARGVAPTAPAAALILLLRALTDIDRSLVVALAELSAYSIAVIALTLMLERSLLAEAVGYLRGKWERVPAAQSAGLTQIE
jgi:hypothetical protein